MDDQQPNSRGTSAAPPRRPALTGAARAPIASPRDGSGPLRSLPAAPIVKRASGQNFTQHGGSNATGTMSAATGAFLGGARVAAAKAAPKNQANRGFISGAFIGEAYQYERVLAEGGMSIVVAARYIPANKRVAIKLLKPEMLTDRELMSRFAREARTAPRIKSRYCVKILDSSADEKRGPFMVMEYLQGRGLRNLIDAGPVPLATAVDFVGQICDALASAHRLGIVHRDIKPENIFLVREGDDVEEVRVLDFGISKVAMAAPGSAGAESLVATSAVLGSPLYMSPEQMRASTKLDARTDIWSVGVTLYEMLYGKPPFVAVTFAELCAQVLSSPAPPIGDLCPTLPRPVAVAVMRALDRDPEQRFRSIVDFAVALLPFASVNGRMQIERLAAEYGVATPKRAQAARAPLPGGSVTRMGVAGVVQMPMKNRRIPPSAAAPTSVGEDLAATGSSAAAADPGFPRWLLALPIVLLLLAAGGAYALRNQVAGPAAGGASAGQTAAPSASSLDNVAPSPRSSANEPAPCESTTPCEHPAPAESAPVAAVGSGEASAAPLASPTAAAPSLSGSSIATATRPPELVAAPAVWRAANPASNLNPEAQGGQAKPRTRESAAAVQTEPAPAMTIRSTWGAK